jgi:hypothetical protein
MEMKLKETPDIASLYHQALRNLAPPLCGAVDPCLAQLRPMRWQSHAACALREIWKRGAWLKRSNKLAVPLSKIQTDILGLLAAHRDPESYVA